MKTITDREMEISIGRMLRIGVFISAALVFAGGLLYLKNPWIAAPNYADFRPERLLRDGIGGILHGATHLNAASVIELGILCLIATPITRVAFCIVGFARQRDRLYVLISASVLMILIYSLFQGHL
jgi:uncharacterized membrane protein